MQMLLAAGADPRAQDTQHGRTALHTAAMANDVELVKVSYVAFLVLDVTSVSYCSSSSLKYAIIISIVEQIILSAGVDVNIRNVHNTIPLHVALARGAKSCVGLLLSAGANCNLQVYPLLSSYICIMIGCLCLFFLIIHVVIINGSMSCTSSTINFIFKNLYKFSLKPLGAVQ